MFTKAQKSKSFVFNSLSAVRESLLIKRPPIDYNKDEDEDEDKV
jgi:hypothetical protein